MPRKVLTGLDVLRANHFKQLKGARLGILANQSSVDREFCHLVDLASSSSGLDVVRLFAPEHGFRGALQDMEQVTSSIDPLTQLEIVTLYGSGSKSLAPTSAALEDLDILVVDLPDIGSRYYTFATTLAYAMQVCGSYDVTVVVLDRPNPIDGVTIEGAALAKECHSFCGFTPVANRHGLTLGELARITQQGFGEGDDAVAPVVCELEIIAAKGWKREHGIEQTGLPWVIPSPNMPTPHTALVYPGTCLFEATNLSEGRGTTRPFELLGAPFINGRAWAKAVEEEGLQLEGAILRPTSFIPKFQKWRDQECSGVQIHVTDRASFKPLRWGLALISAAHRLYPDHFKWRNEEYEFVKDVPAIDLLYGTDRFRKLVTGNGMLSELGMELAQFESWYAEARRSFLLY